MGTAAEDESAPMSLFMENAFSIQTYQTCQDSQWKSTHILVEHTHECTIMCMYMCVSRGAAERPAPASTRSSSSRCQSCISQAFLLGLSGTRLRDSAGELSHNVLKDQGSPPASPRTQKIDVATPRVSLFYHGLTIR